MDTVAADLTRLPHALAWPTAWTVNGFAQKAASFYFEALAKAYPMRVITPPIPFVNSVSELLAGSLGSPSGPQCRTSGIFCDRRPMRGATGQANLRNGRSRQRPKQRKLLNYKKYYTAYCKML